MVIIKNRANVYLRLPVRPMPKTQQTATNRSQHPQSHNNSEPNTQHNTRIRQTEIRLRYNVREYKHKLK